MFTCHTQHFTDIVRGWTSHLFYIVIQSVNRTLPTHTHWTLYTIYIARCKLQTIYSYWILYNINCSLYIAHGTLSNEHCTLNTVHWTLHTAHGILISAHYTIHTEKCTLHTSNCTIHTVHCTHWIEPTGCGLICISWINDSKLTPISPSPRYMVKWTRSLPLFPVFLLLLLPSLSLPREWRQKHN